MRKNEENITKKKKICEELFLCRCRWRVWIYDKKIKLFVYFRRMKTMLSRLRGNWVEDKTRFMRWTCENTVVVMCLTINVKKKASAHLGPRNQFVNEKNNKNNFRKIIFFFFFVNKASKSSILSYQRKMIGTNGNVHLALTLRRRRPSTPITIGQRCRDFFVLQPQIVCRCVSKVRFIRRAIMELKIIKWNLKKNQIGVGRDQVLR